MSKGMIAAADNLLLRTFKINYLRLTRDLLIHERCRLLVAQIRSIGRNRLRVLDVGCGSGIALPYVDRYCGDCVESYWGIDRHATRLRRRFEFVKMQHRFLDVDLDEPWKDLGTFDLVYCAEVIEHLVDDQRLFCRLSSHVASDGVLLVTTPSKAFVQRIAKDVPGYDRVSKEQDGGHVRVGYELEDFTKLARHSKMKIVSHAWVSHCTVADIRSRAVGVGLFWALRQVRDALFRREGYVIDGPAEKFADNHLSLALAFARA